MAIRNILKGVLLVVMLMGTQSLIGQKVIKQGVLEMKTDSLFSELRGVQLALPPDVFANGGAIFLQIEPNEYFTNQDVLRWVKSGWFRAPRDNRTKFNTNSAVIDENFGGNIKFTWISEFFNDRKTKDLALQIVNFTSDQSFQNVFSPRVTLQRGGGTLIKISVKTEPEFEYTSGIVDLSMDTDGVNILAIDSKGKQSAPKYALEKTIELELEPETYTLVLTKPGVQEVRLENIEVIAGQRVSKSAKLLPEEEAKMILIVKVTDEKGNSLNDFDLILQDRETLQSVGNYPAIESGQRITIPIGEFTVLVEKAGYKSQKKPLDTVELASGMSVNLSFRLESDVQTQPVAVSTSTTSVRPKKRKTGLWFLMLLAAGGGAAYYVTQSGGSSGGGYGSPPALPAN